MNDANSNEPQQPCGEPPGNRTDTGETETLNVKRDAEQTVDALQDADMSFVDALLTSLGESADHARERRVQRVMAAVDRPARKRVATRRSARWLAIATVAAVFLIAVSLVWMQMGRSSLADEILSAVHEASSHPIDRVYAIRRNLPGQDDSRLPQGTLYLRGRHGFVVTWRDVVLGRWMDQFWLVKARKQVTLADNFYWIDAESSPDRTGVSILQELSLQSRHVSLVQLASVADLMQHDYEVELRRVTLEGEPADLLIGRRRQDGSELPQTIRLWSALDSHVIRRAELMWDLGNAISLELVPEGPVTADWYDYSTHCDEDPVVKQIASGT